MNHRPPTLRPLKRIRKGVYRSNCGHWTFAVCTDDQQPRRWLAYLDDLRDPANEGNAFTTLGETVNWTAKHIEWMTNHAT